MLPEMNLRIWLLIIACCAVSSLQTQLASSVKSSSESVSSSGNKVSTSLVTKSNDETQAFRVNGYPDIQIPADAVIQRTPQFTYVLFTNLLLNWMEGHLLCRRYGMELLTYDSREELMPVRQGLFAKFLEYPINGDGFGYEKYLSIWLGYNDLFNEGNFTNLYTGKPFTGSEDFRVGDPNNLEGVEHCLEIWSVHDPEGNPLRFDINDLPCKRKLVVVCKV